MDNVIEASRRFARNESSKSRAPQFEQLKGSSRTSRGDAICIAQRLGEIAQRLSPENPKQVASQWFKALWNGDRWEKRKRYILFAGEDAPDPIASNGSDWAALILQAAASLYPEDTPIAAKERARVCRDVLRGTSFLPALSSNPLRADSAQTLMVALAAKTQAAIEARTEIVELWDALQQTPINIQSYDLEKPEVPPQHSGNPLIAAMYADARYLGDAYSRGPFGKVATKAAAVSLFQYRQFPDSSYRFEPGEVVPVFWTGC